MGENEPMTRILDTMPAFSAYARKAEMESPIVREQLWAEHYRTAHDDVFEAFFATHGSPDGVPAIARELFRIRERAKVAVPLVRELIEKIDPAVGHLLGVDPAVGDLPGSDPALSGAALGVDRDVSPLHVLMVGTFSTNAAVGKLGDDTAVFHCLEWFQTEDGTAILIAHEDTHAWHQLILGAPGPEDDLAWVTFYEGIAIRASRKLVPDKPENDYFWYGHEDFEEWLGWCREHRAQLLNGFADVIDEPAAAETFFGGGLVAGHWRTGFFIADELMKTIGLPLPDLVRLPVSAGRELILGALRNTLAREPG